ncbi:hypothetical protein [[Clostridium] innocuum]|nr:hypothetical protein [[Clostridium] innocuum]
MQEIILLFFSVFKVSEVSFAQPVYADGYSMPLCFLHIIGNRADFL